MSEHHIYLLTETGGDTYCKIGMAVDAEKRLRGLQSGNPRTLRFLGVWRLPTLEAAREAEGSILSYFRNGSAMGEWSVISHDLAKTIVEGAIKNLGYEVVEA